MSQSSSSFKFLQINTTPTSPFPYSFSQLLYIQSKILTILVSYEKAFALFSATVSRCILFVLFNDFCKIVDTRSLSEDDASCSTTEQYVYNYLCTNDLYAPCLMFLMRADTLFRQVGGGWALEIESFLGPVNWHRADPDRRVPFGGQKTREDSQNIPCATLKRRESWVMWIPIRNYLY